MRYHSGEFQRFVTLHIAHRNIVVGAKSVDIQKIDNGADSMSICRTEIESYFLKSELELQEILVFCKTVEVL